MGKGKKGFRGPKMVELPERVSATEFEKLDQSLARIEQAQKGRAKHALFKLRHEVRGGHVHADLFVSTLGPAALANAGRIVMTVDEWRYFVSVLLLGGRIARGTTVLVEESDSGGAANCGGSPPKTVRDES